MKASTILLIAIPIIAVVGFVAYQQYQTKGMFLVEVQKGIYESQKEREREAIIRSMESYYGIPLTTGGL